MRDLPAKVVELVSRLLRGDRRDWGAAMTAELAQLSDGPARWRFAVGCAWAVLIAPAHPGAYAPGVAIRVTFVAGVVGCIAATAYAVTTWPHAAGEISGVTAAWFVAALAAYLWIALRPPNALVAHGDAARRGATVGIVLFLVGAIGRSVIDAFVPPDGDLAIGVFLTVSVGGTLLATAFAMSRARQSFGAGVTASLWVALVCSILAFNVDGRTANAAGTRADHRFDGSGPRTQAASLARHCVMNRLREQLRSSHGTVAVFEDLYGNLWDLLEWTQGEA